MPRTGRRLRIAVRSLKSLENRPRRGRRFSYSRFQAAALPVPRAKKRAKPETVPCDLRPIRHVAQAAIAVARCFLGAFFGCFTATPPSSI